ncbi:MAG TPA: hypothetical protein VIA64_05525 [Burkholderiales bacterium]|jgi:hypothetical protein
MFLRPAIPMNRSDPSAICTAYSETARSRRRLPLESSRVRRALILGVSLLAWPDARGDAGSVARCIHQVGEFGNEMVQICVDEDVAAEKALSEYPKETQQIVARCLRNVEETGWVIARRCADKDIAAADALADHPQEHKPLIQKCIDEVGNRGPARVKACVDQEIAAGQMPRQD